jgi:hypothetical protein
MSRTREKRNAIKNSVGKPEGRSPLGKLRWKDDIKKALKERRFADVDWIRPAQYKDK